MSCLSDLLEHVSIEQFGSDQSLEELMCYEMATRSAKLSEIKLVKSGLKRFLVRLEQNPASDLAGGCCWDEDNQEYVDISNLPDEIADNLTSSPDNTYTMSDVANE
jgi:hypothetical protein